MSHNFPPPKSATVQELRIAEIRFSGVTRGTELIGINVLQWVGITHDITDPDDYANELNWLSIGTIAKSGGRAVYSNNTTKAFLELEHVMAIAAKMEQMNEIP